MCKVTVNGKAQYAEKGTLLSDFLMQSDFSLSHPCGGKGFCRKCTVTVNGREELSCQYRIETDITVILPEKDEIFSESGAGESGRMTENLCFALDIGTTTLALAVVSLDEKKIIRVHTRTNPQRKFGSDVMTRIEHCMKNGVSQLNAVLINEVNSMIKESGAENVWELFVSGNTTMLHTFFGVDCSSMGVFPYTPVFLGPRTEKAEMLGINGVQIVKSLPSVAAFVGADIVAGINFTDVPENGRYSLLIDLGTNAEIVLFSDRSALCTSAAAGPCFEGANISCGMSATRGAIFSYSENEIRTIGDAPAKGVCGTGLVDIIAEFIRTEIIDETGFMECEAFEISDGVSINQADIRQYQLAKSAVCSAIEVLFKRKNVSADDIENVYISGGFSAKINAENAVRTGLFPKELKNKCIPVNNSSLLGTVKYACENDRLILAEDSSTYVDLSSDPDFSDLFIENMMFE